VRLLTQLLPSPPLVTPTVTPVPTADWPMVSALDGFAEPRAGCLDAVALVLKIYFLCLLRRPRGGAVLARVAVRLLCTQEPVPMEDDLWSRAPMSETGLLVLAEVKRHTIADGGVLLTRWFAFSAHGGRRPRSMTHGPGPRVRGWVAAFGRDEEAHYRRWWRAPHAAVHLLRTRRPTPKEYDSWARAPVSEARPLLSAEMKRCITVGGGVLLTRRFTFFAHGGRRLKSMTRGLGPPCQRLGRCFRRR
jgi:hypothetical protein